MIVQYIYFKIFCLKTNAIKYFNVLKICHARFKLMVIRILNLCFKSNIKFWVVFILLIGKKIFHPFFFFVILQNTVKIVYSENWYCKLKNIYIIVFNYLSLFFFLKAKEFIPKFLWHRVFTLWREYRMLPFKLKNLPNQWEAHCKGSAIVATV